MTLTFTQENGLYVAEFEATAPFSIHLERPRGGFINMLQRSVDSGTFVAVKNFNPNYNATQVIDADCGQGAVYPKWIRLESAVEPSVAEVTFEDEQSGGGAGEIVYVKSENLPQGAALMLLSMFSVIAAVKNNGAIYIMPPSTAANMFPDAEVVGVGYMPNMEVVLSSGKATIAENFAESGVTEDVLAPCIITKEQFYNLEA